MTSVRPPDPAKVARRDFDPSITPYEQGRRDRLAGRLIHDSPYGAMGNQQRWQEGWTYQNEEIKRLTEQMRDHHRKLGKEAL